MDCGTVCTTSERERSTADLLTYVGLPLRLPLPLPITAAAFRKVKSEAAEVCLPPLTLH